MPKKKEATAAQNKDGTPSKKRGRPVGYSPTSRTYKVQAEGIAYGKIKQAAKATGAKQSHLVQVLFDAWLDEHQAPQLVVAFNDLERRRRIQDLEAQAAALETQLAAERKAAQGRLFEIESEFS